MVNPGRRKNKASFYACSEPEAKKHKSQSKPPVAADTASITSDFPDINSKASQKQKSDQAAKAAKAAKAVILDLTESKARPKSTPHKKKQAGSPRKSPKFVMVN